MKNRNRWNAVQKEQSRVAEEGMNHPNLSSDEKDDFRKGVTKKRKDPPQNQDAFEYKSQCDIFLRQLMETVMDSNIQDIIRVHPSDSKSFEIRQPNLFLEKVLPYRFGLRKLGAFQNRLTKHGFEMTSEKLSKLELCGFKAPQAASKHTAMNLKGDSPQLSDFTCSITFRHPVIQMDSVKIFHSTEKLWQAMKEHNPSRLPPNVTSEDDDSSHLKPPSIESKVLKNAYETLDNDKRMRDVGIFEEVEDSEKASNVS
jgi:hypothetical protein